MYSESANHDQREKVLRKLGQMTDKYEVVGRIEQNIPFHKLRNLNFDLLGEIIRGDPIKDSTVEEKLTRWSYTRLFMGEGIVTASDKDIFETFFWMDLYRETSDLDDNSIYQAMSIMLKVSTEIIISVLNKTEIPNRPLTSITLKEMAHRGLSTDVIKTVPIHFVSIISQLVNNNFCCVVLTASNIKVLEKIVIVDDLPMSKYFAIFKGAVVRIRPEQRYVASLFMKFQIFLATDYKIFFESLDTFIENMENILEFVNQPSVRAILPNQEAEFLDDEMLNEIYYVPVSSTGEAVSTSYVKTIELEEFSHKTISNNTKLSLSNFKVCNVDAALVSRIYTKHMSVVESVQNSVLETIYSCISEYLPDQILEANSVHIIDDSFTINQTKTSFGVLIGDASSVLTVNDVEVEVESGQLLIISSNNCKIEISSGVLVLYV